MALDPFSREYDDTKGTPVQKARRSGTQTQEDANRFANTIRGLKESAAATRQKENDAISARKAAEAANTGSNSSSRSLTPNQISEINRGASGTGVDSPADVVVTGDTVNDYIARNRAQIPGTKIRHGRGRRVTGGGPFNGMRTGEVDNLAVQEYEANKQDERFRTLKAGQQENNLGARPNASIANKTPSAPPMTGPASDVASAALDGAEAKPVPGPTPPPAAASTAMAKPSMPNMGRARGSLSPNATAGAGRGRPVGTKDPDEWSI